jgi:hypothetical protein
MNGTSETTEALNDVKISAPLLQITRSFGEVFDGR